MDIEMRSKPGKPNEYEMHYSDEKFWDKLKNQALKAGHKVVSKALELYYAGTAKETPLWAKTLIFGALGYFILPIDAIPDMIPVAGFTDDLTMLLGAITSVGAHMTPEHRAKAEETLQKWFGKKKNEEGHSKEQTE